MAEAEGGDEASWLEPAELYDLVGSNGTQPRSSKYSSGQACMLSVVTTNPSPSGVPPVKPTATRDGNGRCNERKGLVYWTQTPRHTCAACPPPQTAVSGQRLSPHQQQPSQAKRGKTGATVALAICHTSSPLPTTLPEPPQTTPHFHPARALSSSMHARHMAVCATCLSVATRPC